MAEAAVAEPSQGYTALDPWPGSWTCPFRLPATPIPQVRQVLTDLAQTSGWPVAAFLYGEQDEPVTRLLLYRDPSRHFGAPSVPESMAAARALAERTGWASKPASAPRGGLLVGLGLREGYAPDAPEHRLRDVVDRLASQPPGWTCRPARLVSARVVDGGVRWYDEQGAVVHGPAGLLPAITAAAAELAQQRFVVTDLEQHRVYAVVSGKPQRSAPVRHRPAGDA